MSQEILQKLSEKDDFTQLSHENKHEVLKNLRDLAIETKKKCQDETFLDNIASWIDPNDEIVKRHAQEISGLYHLPYPTKTHCLGRLILKIPEISFKSFFKSIKFSQATYVLAYVDPTQLSYHNLENILLMDYYFKHSKLDDVVIETQEVIRDDDPEDSDEDDTPEIKPIFNKSHGVDIYLTKFNNLQPIIKELDKPEFYLKPFNQDERGGKRFIFKSLLLSQQLTKLIKDATKKLTNFQSFSHVNPVFRLNSFESSDSNFSYHYDTAYYDKNKRHLSRYTIVIYLTKGTQEKGILNIDNKEKYDLDSEEACQDDIFELNQNIKKEKSENFSLEKVEIGDCVIFNHKYNHQGNPFKEGKKLFLRSELVFDASELKLDSDPKLAKIFASSCYMFIESMRKNDLSEKIRKISNEQFNIANRARFNLNNKVNKNNSFLIKRVYMNNIDETTEMKSDNSSSDNDSENEESYEEIVKNKTIHSNSDTELTDSNWKIDSDDNLDESVNYRTRRVNHFGSDPDKIQKGVEEKQIKNQDIFMTNGTDYYFNLNSYGLQTDNESYSIGPNTSNLDKIKYFTILTLMDYFKGKVQEVGKKTINDKIRIETMDIFINEDEQTLLDKLNEEFFKNMVTCNFPYSMENFSYSIKEYEKYDISKLDFDSFYHCNFCTSSNEMDYVINKFRNNLEKLFQRNKHKCRSYSLCIFDNIYINCDDIQIGKNLIKFKNSGQDSGINFASCQGCDYGSTSNMSTHEITTRIGQGFKIPTLAYEILGDNIHISIDMFNNDFCVDKVISYNTQVKPVLPYHQKDVKEEEYIDRVDYPLNGYDFRKPLIKNNKSTLDAYKKEDIEIYTTSVFNIQDDSQSMFDLDCIKNSQLFLELGSDEIITAIPKKYKSIKLDKNNRIIIRNKYDFYEVLNTLRFFGVKNIPYEIYDFILQNKNECVDILEDEFRDYFLNELLLLVNTKIEKAYIYSEFSNRSIIQTSNNYIIKQVLLNGNLNLLKYLHENKYVFQDQDYRYAIKNGHINCFKYMHYNGLINDGYVCHWAIKYNQTNILTIGIELGYVLDTKNFNLAIYHGHVEMIKYFIENCPTFNKAKARDRIYSPWGRKGKNEKEILALL